MNIDEAIQISCIIDKLPPSWKDFKHTLKHKKKELTRVELGSHLRIEESLRVQDSDKPKSNNVAGPSVVNMVEHNNSSRYNDNKGIANVLMLATKPNKSGTKDSMDGLSNSLKGATVHVCKDRCWFKTYALLNNGSILHMGNESTTLVHGRSCVDLRLNIVNDNIGSAFMLTFKLNDSILWHARLGHIHFKRMQDMSKDGLIPNFDMDTKKCKTCMLNKITKKPFQNVKGETEVLELIHNDLYDMYATPSFGNSKYFVTFIDDALRAVVRLPDLELKTLSERGIKCIFVGYVKHSKAFRFSSVPRPSFRILNGTEDIGGLVVTKEVVQQLKPELRKSKRNRTPTNFGPKFQLYLIKGTRDEVSDQHSYSFNVEDDPKTFDKAMKSQDVSFWKEAINDEMDSIMGKQNLGVGWSTSMLQTSWLQMDLQKKTEVARISTIRLLIAIKSIHNLIIHQMDVKTAFLNGELDGEQAPKQWHQKFDEVVLSNGYLLNQADKYQVDLTKEFLSSRFSIKDMGEANVILVSTPMDTNEKLMPNNGQVVSQLEYSRVVGCLMYVMTCTRHDITFVVGKLSMYTSNPGTQHWKAIQWVLKYLKKTMDYRLMYTGYPLVLEGYTDATWISNTEDNSSTSGWVFLLGGGAISWALKKQTCITSSTMESKFVALAAAVKEAEWLKNLLFEIPLRSKPIAPISICYNSAATLAKAYSQMYNGKSRHLGVRHSMIRELIMNGVVSVEFVRSQQNLADHLTKGLARDLVIKSVEGM
ncbi:zinc finger, CCHC-type containing protein [Tanacetum coccineum]